MNKTEISNKIAELKDKATMVRREVDYYNALQLSLKLILNGSYGALAAKYFVLFNEYVAGTITAEGRELTQTMDKNNEDYWFNQWHLDKETHRKLCIRDVRQISNKESVSIYADTDSLFVSMKPAIDHCTWKDLLITTDKLSSMNKPFILIYGQERVIFKNEKCIKSLYINDFQSKTELANTLSSVLSDNPSVNIIIDGKWISDREMYPVVKNIKGLYWNWTTEIDFLHGIDILKYGQYFKDCLDAHAATYGVQNTQDFEMERISESMISIAKKKYISHILFEDGVPYDRMTYLYPKGVELVRRSTPLFARERIPTILEYLFRDPDNFNIKELIKIIKGMRKEFGMCVPDRIDEISMQSSCSNYKKKVLCDKDKLEFVVGSHFAVKASAYHNYLLHKNSSLLGKYEHVKSGDKIKYYYCKDKSVNAIFAYSRGSYPIEYAPDIDLDTQFAKSILSPINSIIVPLGLPTITERLSVVVDIFGGM
jgi:DNA polymerase elongation subunit (family B)